MSFSRSAAVLRMVVSSPVVSSLMMSILGLVVVGCGRPEADPLQPNIVVVLIDTLRADRLGTYGYEADTSPRLDHLAEQMVVFERAHSPAPWTLPSVVSLMLSQPVCEHGVVVDRQQIAEHSDPLAAILSRLGYRTGAFYVNPYAGKMSGLDRGFQHSELVTQQIDGDKVSAWLDTEPPAQAEERKPFFLYLHNTEPHRAFSAEDKHLQALGHSVKEEEKAEIKDLLRRFRRLTRVDFIKGLPLGTTDNTDRQISLMDKLTANVEIYSQLYDAQVRAADERVGSIVDTLVGRDLWDDTFFVLLADHGEEMGEHGGWLHDQSVYEEMIRVPLLIKLPGGRYGGRRIQLPVSLLDVMPTILEVAGAPGLANGIRGQSLLTLLSSAGSQPRSTAIRLNRKKHFRPFKQSRGDLNVAVIDGEWKGIFNPEVNSFELYDLSTDPGESHDLSSSQPGLARRLLAVARSGIDACAGGTSGVDPDAPLDPEQLEALQSLGYLSADEQ